MKLALYALVLLTLATMGVGYLVASDMGAFDQPTGRWSEDSASW